MALLVVFNVYPGVFDKVAEEKLRASSPLRGTTLERFNYFFVEDKKFTLNLATLRGLSTQLGVCSQVPRE